MGFSYGLTSTSDRTGLVAFDGSDAVSWTIVKIKTSNFNNF